MTRSEEMLYIAAPKLIAYRWRLLLLLLSRLTHTGRPNLLLDFKFGNDTPLAVPDDSRTLSVALISPQMITNQLIRRLHPLNRNTIIDKDDKSWFI